MKPGKDGDREIMNHVALQGFGLDIDLFSEETPLGRLLYRKKIDDDITARLELLEEYDSTFGLYDHSKEVDMFSVMYQHPEEDPITGSSSLNKVIEILSLKVPELTNDSLTNILNYPKWLLDSIIEIARTHRQKDIQAMNALKPPE